MFVISLYDAQGKNRKNELPFAGLSTESHNSQAYLWPKSEAEESMQVLHLRVKEPIAWVITADSSVLY